MGTGNNTNVEPAKVVEDEYSRWCRCIAAGVATELVEGRKSRRLQELTPENQGL